MVTTQQRLEAQKLSLVALPLALYRKIFRYLARNCLTTSSLKILVKDDLESWNTVWTKLEWNVGVKLIVLKQASRDGGVFDKFTFCKVIVIILKHCQCNRDKKRGQKTGTINGDKQWRQKTGTKNGDKKRGQKTGEKNGDKNGQKIGPRKKGQK